MVNGRIMKEIQRKRSPPARPAVFPYQPVGRESGTVSVLPAAKLETSPGVLRALPVGNQEENFVLIREILDRHRSSLLAGLDHASSLEEAQAMLQQSNYALVLFEHETGDAAATNHLADFLQTGCAIPFIGSVPGQRRVSRLSRIHRAASERWAGRSVDRRESSAHD
jgi:hypothetical protein